MGTLWSFTALKGRLFWGLGGAWWLPTPHYVPDGTHDQWEALELIYPDHYDPKGSASEAGLLVCGGLCQRFG